MACKTAPGVTPGGELTLDKVAGVGGVATDGDDVGGVFVAGVAGAVCCSLGVCDHTTGGAGGACSTTCGGDPSEGTGGEDGLGNVFVCGSVG